MDVYNPKVVRASAGAVFGVPIVAARPGVGENDPLDRARGARAPRAGRATARRSGGTAASEVDLTGPVALVLGNEAHGLSDEVLAASTV